MVKVLCICGARPNFIKIAPLVDAFQRCGQIHTILVHTGQHYDEKMSRLFFDELNIPKPDVDLEVGSASHAVQTAEIMKRFEPLCIEHRPDWIVVVGDVNSTIACALVAKKLGIKVAHVEAGLRSFDRTMPEEVNRVLTDCISDLLLVSEPSGVENLRAEGIEGDKVQFVGNVMIDTLEKNRQRASRSDILDRLKLTEQDYVLVTLHRPSNVDDADALGAIMQALREIAEQRTVVFPMHPRTRKNLESFGIDVTSPLVGGEKIAATPPTRGDATNNNFHIIEPLGYLDFLKLMSHAFVVLTDSGGMQEETTILGVPCLTLRENTERPVTITEGTNQLVRPNRDAILTAYRSLPAVDQTGTDSTSRSTSVPALWDGKAADRITKALIKAST